MRGAARRTQKCAPGSSRSACKHQHPSTLPMVLLHANLLLSQNQPTSLPQSPVECAGLHAGLTRAHQPKDNDRFQQATVYHKLLCITQGPRTLVPPTCSVLQQTRQVKFGNHRISGTKLRDQMQCMAPLCRHSRFPSRLDTDLWR
jgi:hypothetical protein